MLRVSRFRPDPGRTAEFLASLWQGAVPEDLHLHQWLYVETVPREMVLVWEGGDAARDWVELVFASFGTLTTEVVTDSTGGLAACLRRDLAGFGQWLRDRGTDEDEISRQLDVRRRGLDAASHDDAVAAGRAWAGEQPSG